MQLIHFPYYKSDSIRFKQAISYIRQLHCRFVESYAYDGARKCQARRSMMVPLICWHTVGDQNTPSISNSRYVASNGGRIYPSSPWRSKTDTPDLAATTTAVVPTAKRCSQEPKNRKEDKTKDCRHCRIPDDKHPEKRGQYHGMPTYIPT